jgi:hypothetical protein
MIYVKCILTGVGALFATSILYVYGYYIFLVRPRLPKVPPGNFAALWDEGRVRMATQHMWKQGWRTPIAE